MNEMTGAATSVTTHGKAQAGGHPLRGALNSLFLPGWTMAMVSYAAAGVSLTRDRDFFRRMERVWARGIAGFSDIEVSAFGAERVDPQGRYVIVSNHLSHLDIVVLFMTLPVVPGFIAKRELARIPFLATALDLGGHVLIDRGDKNSARRSMAQAAEAVSGGKTVLVFPEGTRGDSDTIGTFKSGAFHLAKAADVPILPVGIRGSRSVLPKHGRLIQPGRIAVHIGAPVMVERVRALPARQLMAHTRTRIAELADMPLREAVEPSAAERGNS